MRVGVGLEVEVEAVAVGFDAGVDDFGIVNVSDTCPVGEGGSVDAHNLLLLADVSAAAAAAAVAAAAFSAPCSCSLSVSSDNAANRLSNSSPVPAAAQNFMYRSTILS